MSRQRIWRVRKRYDHIDAEIQRLSSDWELKSFDKRYPPTMKVDWARVWQR